MKKMLLALAIALTSIIIAIEQALVAHNFVSAIGWALSCYLSMICMYYVKSVMQIDTAVSELLTQMKGMAEDIHDRRVDVQQEAWRDRKIPK